jgi:hypothetical protein
VRFINYLVGGAMLGIVMVPVLGQMHALSCMMGYFLAVVMLWMLQQEP